MRILYKSRPTSLARHFVLGLVVSLLALACAHAESPSAQTARQITLSEALIVASKNIDAQIAQQSLTAAKADVTAANRAPLPVLSSSVSQIDLQNGVGAGSWLQDKRVDKNIGVDWT